VWGRWHRGGERFGVRLDALGPVSVLARAGIERAASPVACCWQCGVPGIDVAGRHLCCRRAAAGGIERQTIRMECR
jgi:hypothetical protein